MRKQEVLKVDPACPGLVMEAENSLFQDCKEPGGWDSEKRKADEEMK